MRDVVEIVVVEIVVVEIEVVVIDVEVIDVVVCVVSVPDVVVDVPLAWRMDGGCGWCMAVAAKAVAAKARRSRCGCRGTLVIAHPSPDKWPKWTKYDEVQALILRSSS